MDSEAEKFAAWLSEAPGPATDVLTQDQMLMRLEVALKELRAAEDALEEVKPRIQEAQRRVGWLVAYMQEQVRREHR